MNSISLHVLALVTFSKATIIIFAIHEYIYLERVEFECQSLTLMLKEFEFRISINFQDLYQLNLLEFALFNEHCLSISIIHYLRSFACILTIPHFMVKLFSNSLNLPIWFELWFFKTLSSLHCIMLLCNFSIYFGAIKCYIYFKDFYFIKHLYKPYIYFLF